MQKFSCVRELFLGYKGLKEHCSQFKNQQRTTPVPQFKPSSTVLQKTACLVNTQCCRLNKQQPRVLKGLFLILAFEAVLGSGHSLLCLNKACPT